MATQQASPKPSTNHAANKAKKAGAPPDEQFWVRDSPNHEFPISTLASVMLHILFYLAAAFLISSVFWPKDSTDAVPMDEIALEPSGGGGNVNGVGKGAGDGVLPKERTEQAARDSMQTEPDKLVKNDIPLPQPQINTPKLDVPNVRYVPDKGGDFVARIEALRHEVQETQVGPVAGKGQGGTGKGGGKGSGNGPGIGDAGGPGNSRLTPTERRLLRRVIHYDVGDGDLYRQELAALHIVLAVRETRQDGSAGFRVYRDLNHVPPTGELEDPSALRRTFWKDDKPETVHLLARALHIRPPEAFYAFLPPELEMEMLKKELAFHHVQESRIKKTVFEVVPTKDGYDIVVKKQELYDN